MSDGLMQRSALELASLVRAGEVTSRELVEASLAAIDERNGKLNAFTWIGAEQAFAAADEIRPGDERPFAGVPVVIKDLMSPMAGVPEWQGSELIGDAFKPDFDGFVVRRIRAAGFVIVGRTTTPEFGILPSTESRRTGPTRNPFDPARTPGGSSGGTGAAIASGMVPIGHGSDGGGSIRIPAACCGLVGLKPARGRVSFGPLAGESALAVHGGLTRTVADSAAFLDVVAGYELGDATWAPPPAEPFAVTAAREPGRLRIGVTTTPAVDTPVEEPWRSTVDEAAELLASLGHEVETIENPPWGQPGLFDMFMVLWAALSGAGVRFSEMLTGQQAVEERAEKLTWHFYELAQKNSSLDFVMVSGALQSFARNMIAALAQYDAVLTPALATDPPPIGKLNGDGPDPEQTFWDSAAFTPFTSLFNLSGQPAISLPWWREGATLPHAIQLAGRPAGEGQLLALAAQIEQARPWAGRTPDPAVLTG
jgi:amidase